jgi:hypothetical protein
MKKLIALVLFFTLTLLALVSCGSGDTPPGMQLLSDKDLDGMLLYVPEQYTVFRDATTGVMLATLSRLDPTSISGYVVYPIETSIAEYVTAHFDLTDLGENAALVPLDPALGLIDYPILQKIDGRDAPTYEWSFSRGETEYRTMQVYIPRDAEDLSKGVAVLTYTARMTESVTGLVAYTKHLEDFQKTLQVFRFTDKLDVPAPEAPTPINGMLLASDPKITNYSLFVPESYTLDLQIGISSAFDPSDRTSVTAAYCYPEGTKSVAEYISERLLKYEDFFETCVKLIPADAELNEEGEKNDYVALTVDGCTAFRYEFLGTLDGVSFRFAEVLILRQKGLTQTGLYTVTMTASGESETVASERLDAHRTELSAILDAFRFN